MSDRSHIEWTDATWNPLRGCTKVSPGCKHCYAETFAERFRGVPGHPYEQGFDLRLVPEKLEDPLRWRKPRRVFVNSMSDLFHEDVPDEFIWQVFAVMANARQHTFQVLTKRADRLAVLLATGRNAPYFYGNVRGTAFRMKLSDSFTWPLPNCWIGVSCEDRKHGLPRLDLLRQTPAAVRFVSFEPLLEDLGTVALTGIGWAIIGGESGAGARRCDLAWIRGIVDQCRAAGVACFVKQLGTQSGHDFGATPL